MKLKLDENLSRHLKPKLEAAGHEVHTVQDEGLVGHPDTDVGRAARAEARMLFTLDVEFADLRKHPPGSHPGIVLFRPRSLGPRSVQRVVMTFIDSSDLAALAGCVIIVEPGRIRVRRDLTPPSR